MSNVGDPAVFAKTVVPADADMATQCRSIYVGGTGNIQVTTVGGDVAVFQNVPAGTVLPVQAKRIWATNTTATNMIAMQ